MLHLIKYWVWPNNRLSVRACVYFIGNVWLCKVLALVTVGRESFFVEVTKLVRPTSWPTRLRSTTVVTLWRDFSTKNSRIKASPGSSTYRVSIAGEHFHHLLHPQHQHHHRHTLEASTHAGGFRRPLAVKRGDPQKVYQPLINYKV